ncbi:MAG TPA: alpha/beta fold hydrolase [Dermatophilaceae bacterium]|nr:alpha/beta fold hydrolase [Dermatophilaceae bacterium]
MDPLGRPTFGASVAPDGTAFAHLVDDGGYPHAVQRFLDGTSVSSSRNVRLPVEGPVVRLRHSPDGRWLACQTAPYAGTRSQVWVVTTDPRDPDAWRLDDTADGSADLVGWDGDRVVLAAEVGDGDGEARLVDPRSGVVTVLDRRPLGHVVDVWAGSVLLRVGPRGDRALHLLRAGRELPLLPRDPGSVTDAGVLLDDHRPRRLLLGAPGAGARRYLPATWDAPGRFEGYVRAVVRTDHGSDRARLVAVTATPDGVATRELAARPDADLDEFVVSADTSTAAMLWNVGGGRSELQLLELTDGTLREPVEVPAPVASELSVSADGSLLALTVEGPGQPRCVELVAPRTGEWVAIERVRTATREVRPRLLRLEARDGTPLTAWLHRPRHRVGPGPVLVDLHGGPEGQARPGHSDLYPVLLDAGVTVVAPNVRGSGGFGRRFVHADDKHRRTGAVDDVADLVARLVATGVADPSRVVCAGWSYGGYLTLAALAAHPGLFAAGVSVCGMSDLGTFYAGTEPWIGLAAHEEYGHPVADRALLARLSPLGRAEAIRAPVLAVHGAHDTNVPVEESRQVVAAVRATGGRARLVVVEGEGHRFTIPQNRARLARLVTDWCLAAFAGADPSSVPDPWSTEQRGLASLAGAPEPR